MRTPRTHTVIKLARVLGVAPGWLAYGLGSQTEFKADDNGAGLTARLKAMRTLRSLSRAALAEAAGVQVGAIQNIEEGQAAPRINTIERLAIALDVTPAWLAFGEGESPAALDRPAAPL
jgi:DNA-binding XRE family transcriptional regulator